MAVRGATAASSNDAEGTYSHSGDAFNKGFEGRQVNLHDLPDFVRIRR